MAPPAKPLLPGPTPPMSVFCARDREDNCREMALRVHCLDSGWGTPTASQLRRLLGLQCAVGQVVAGDRCEVAVYESPNWTANVTLQLERSPKDSFMHIVLKW
ncbi:hypothetical protein V5799_007347 [Amblyomma americanum]|uniref:Uncharacterized protein n=1 Tax=Amblyomma americanum TaxID=6943 RepID=A0AAQ4DTT0_AMBAM